LAQDVRRRLTPALASLLLVACGGGQPELPPPRPLVVTSGARLTADAERLKAIHEWVTLEMENIREDPTFYIESIPGADETYPWETLIISGDTARFQYGRGNPDVETSYMIYAHLYLMKRMGRLDEWLPEAAEAEGYELEREIVSRMADSWLLGRAIFDTQPSRAMDELIYAKEAGFLDEFVLTARPDDFDEAREGLVAEGPGRLDEYKEWFQETFGTDPPGIRTRR
jgi:hypothetical protein